MNPEALTSCVPVRSLKDRHGDVTVGDKMFSAMPTRRYEASFQWAVDILFNMVDHFVW